MIQPRPNAQNAKRAIIAITGVLFIMILSYVTNIIIGTVFSLTGISAETSFSLIIVISQALRILYIAAFIYSVIAFLQWFRNAYYNISLISKNEYDISWSVKAWFIPIINLYIPYKLMKEVYHRADECLIEKSLSAESGEIPIKRLGSNLLAIWWICTLIAFLAIIIHFGLSQYKSPMDIDINTIMYLSALRLVISFIKMFFITASGILLIYIIKNYNKAESVIFNRNNEPPVN